MDTQRLSSSAPQVPALAEAEEAPSTVAVEIDQLTFGYRTPPTLVDVTFAVQHGEFVAVVGPSGCGKSTLLLLVAGLLEPWRGSVRVNGVPVQGPGPDRAMVFQHFALLPWKSVLDNVALGLRYRRSDLSRAQRRERAWRYLDLVGLAPLARAYPGQLSGGMQQRVGLARAFAVEPSILLMDEPFGALDAQNAEVMQAELYQLVTHGSRSVLLVTHNLDEALFLADRVVVMGAGPSGVIADVPIELSHPRRSTQGAAHDSTRYDAYRAHLWECIRQEVVASQGWGKAGE